MVVEDIAVLIDLEKRDAFVLRGRFDHRAEMLDVDVDRSSHEGRLTCDRQRERINRVVDGTRGRRLRPLAEFGRGTVLALRQTIDPVIKKDVVNVKIPPDGVHKMIAANGEGITVACNDPDAEIWIGTLDAGRNCRRATMNAVESIGVHVVGESRRATDA